MTTTNTSIAAATLAMAASLAKYVTVVEKEIKFDKAAYVETLPEGITVDTIKQIQEHNSVFFPAVEHAIGTAGNSLMKANDDIVDLKTTVSLVGRDRYEVKQVRMRESVNPQDRTVVVQKWGAISSNLITHAAEKGAEMGHVRSFLNEEAKAAYGK